MPGFTLTNPNIVPKLSNDVPLLGKQDLFNHLFFLVPYNELLLNVPLHPNSKYNLETSNETYWIPTSSTHIF